MDYETLKNRQSLNLTEKIYLSQQRIHEWYEAWDGNVSVSFSGGRDSTVLLDMVRKLYPDAPAVFVNTGLEYPEITEFVRTKDNVEWLRPKIPFHQVIKKYGYPVVSKAQSRAISDVANANPNNKATVRLRLTGINRAGKHNPSMMLSKKWRYLVNAPFKISDKCCHYIKEQPIKKYLKDSGLAPFIGVRAAESNRRRIQYIKNGGCNYYDSGAVKSLPLSFWTDEDINNYIKIKNLQYSKIYDMGEKRTGCMFCMFGVHLEKGKNRFQRMKVSHPKHYNYCINKLECGKVLDYMGVRY